MAQRLYAMGQLLKPGKKILVTHPAAFLRYLPNPTEFKTSTIHLEKGCKTPLDDLKSRLVELGYRRVNKIDQSLEFALRGDILDIFSVNETSPIRVEFFDDEVEAIKEFDIQTQSSSKELNAIDILPATDLFLTDDELSSFAHRVKERLEEDCKTLPMDPADILRDNVSRDLEDFVNRDYKPSLYKYFGFALNHPFSILSYFDPALVFIAGKEGFVAATDLLTNEAHTYLGELQAQRLITSHLEEYMELSEALPDYRKVFYGLKYAAEPTDPIFTVRNVVTAGSGIAALAPTVQSYLKNDKKVILALTEPHQLETAKSFLDEAKIPYETVSGFILPEGNLAVTALPLSQGFEASDIGIVYLSSAELFGHRIANTRFTSRFKDATILKSYEDLRPGDYVVHALHLHSREANQVRLRNF